MDVLSLLSTSVPSYFVLGPLVVFLIILISLIAKKNKSNTVIQNAAPVTPQAQVSQTTQSVAQQMAAAPVIQAQTPAPAPVPTPTPTPITQVQATVPPVSSWKPAATPAPVVESVTDSEKEMQAKASVSTSTTQASVTPESTPSAIPVPTASAIELSATQAPEAPTQEIPPTTSEVKP